jgi:cell division protein FtsL
MSSLKDLHRTQTGQPAQPILAAKRRRQLYPFFFHMGPVTLCTTSVLLIGLMAILYLNQVGQAVAVNQQLQTIHYQQASLQRQNEDLVLTVSTEQSPGYVAAHAEQMGLVPANPKDVQILVVKPMAPIPVPTQGIHP